MLYTRISSGLDFLDAAIGGLYSNRCYLLRGPSQSGRTTMCMQFLLDGLENAESTMMISSDRIENVILKSEAMGLSLEQFLMENRLILMEYPKEISESNFQYSHIIKLLGEIDQYLKHYNCTRLVFDTLIPLLSHQPGTHLVNYIYSLINSLEELKVTTLLTTGEPNSAPAQRITQLVEDAVVGSFVLSDTSSRQGSQKHFSIYKMVNPIKPPTTFRVAIEYGRGVILDQPTEKETPAERTGVTIRDLLNLPLNIALIFTDDDLYENFKEIFHNDSHIEVFDSIDDFIMQNLDLDYDFVVLNTEYSPFEWKDMIVELHQQFSNLPVFVVADRKNAMRANQTARQAGADALFVNPVDPNDVVGALYKSLKKHNTLDSLIHKRRSFLAPGDIPEDFSEMDADGAGGEDADGILANLLSPQEFRDRVHRQVWKSRQNETNFALVSFKMVYTSTEVQRENMHHGLELVRKVAWVAQTSLRGLDDSASRYMDKVIVLLENTDKTGAKAFEKRVVKELRIELMSKLNLQVGKHINLLSAIVTFPKDGDEAEDLLHQVTDVSRNFVKSAS